MGPVQEAMPGASRDQGIMALAVRMTTVPINQRAVQEGGHQLGCRGSDQQPTEARHPV